MRNEKRVILSPATLTKDLFFFLFIYLAVLGLNCGTQDLLCGSQTP